MHYGYISMASQHKLVHSTRGNSVTTGSAEFRPPGGLGTVFRFQITYVFSPSVDESAANV